MARACVGVFFIIVCSTWLEGISSTKLLMADKVNLGWPNFFNPEKAILRKDRDAQKRKKAFEKDHFEEPLLGSSQELLSDNRLANVIKDNDRQQWQDLQDLRIKDELRGTVIALTGGIESSRAWEDLLDPEIFEAIKADLGNQTDVYHTLSEATADGVLLGTPLFRRRFAPSLGKYGAELTYFGGPTARSLIYYGNWCGRGGRVAPVDEVDECCLQHAKCYGRGVRLCPDVWDKPYSTMYAWTLLEGYPHCVRSESTCVNTVCGCDLEAAMCLGLHLGTFEDDLNLHPEVDHASFE